MRRLAALFSLLIALTGGLVVTSTSPAAAGDKVPVPYGMSAFGFGAKVKGGDLPVGSGPIARAIIACNNIAGISKSNSTASVDLPGLGTIDGVETKTWTRKKGDTVSTYTQQTIADVKLLETGAGTIAITAVQAWTRAYHDSTGYHTDARTSVLGLKYTPPVGAPVTLPLPTPGQPIVIPGVATIGLGGTTQVHGKNRAVAQATGLRVHLDATNTTVAVARAVARMGEATNGVFGGIAYGLKASVLGDIVGVGQTPQVFMPCAGTDGEVLESSVASVPLTGVLDAGVARVTEQASATRKVAKGWEQAEIADVDLLDGAVHIEAIKARAFVKRERGVRRIVRSAKGTGTAIISVNGEPQEIPLDGLEIPGLLKIETNIVKKLKAGLQVTALRLTLLDGSGAVVDLGVARMRVGQLPR
ncbi:MAG TPA: choice-of-anchor P family protein [Nocardioides sp.]|nr:choice-of-anchor P family protein [Nocardioides sp.]